MIRDIDCSIDTPVILGKRSERIYGTGIRIKPRCVGRKDTKHFEHIYLPELLPLEDYDLIVVLFSGGKDSVACLYKLLELGVPKEKIELWHHDIDGGNPIRHMDWRCTQSYCKALAKAEGIPLRISYRVDGFFGELYRIGASKPIEWIEPGTEEIQRCKPTAAYLKCKEIREKYKDEAFELLKEHGCRMKFPAKGSGAMGRWCSSSLKSSVQDSVTINLQKTKENTKILVVSGERRGESAGRSKYNEMEKHRTNAEAKKGRIVHQWRCVIDYSEKDVWEVLKRNKVNPHPCYRIGWNRCSCSACIFSTPTLMKGYSEIYPAEFKELVEDEVKLGFTIDKDKSLLDYIDGARSCLRYDDREAVRAILTGEIDAASIYTDNWTYPIGAFHGANGGSC